MGCRLTQFDMLGKPRILRDNVKVCAARYHDAPHLEGLVFWDNGKFRGFTFSEAGVLNYLADCAERAKDG